MIVTLILLAVLTNGAFGFFGGGPPTGSSPFGGGSPPPPGQTNFGDPAPDDTAGTPFGSGATGNEPDFTGSDFRCTSMNGQCMLKSETCCPKRWTASSVCASPRWCCVQPTTCDELEGGRCVDTKSDTEDNYCPGTTLMGSPGLCGSENEKPWDATRMRCCKRDSPCETDTMGAGICVTADKCSDLQGTLTSDSCGSKPNFQCCLRPTRSRCARPHKGLFCRFRDSTGLTISQTPYQGITAKQTLDDMCTDGIIPKPADCPPTVTPSCLRKTIPDYLTCVEAACPHAEIITFASLMLESLPDGGNPQCKGKVVGLKIDMNGDVAETCDINNVVQFCEEFKGAQGYAKEEPEGSKIHYVRCNFP